MTDAPRHFDACILGAGPAGLAAAIHCARSGMAVALVDHAAAPAQKLRISGGGKGNVTNLSLSVENYAGHQPEFARHALVQFPPRALFEWLNGHDFTLEERENRQIFGCQPATRLADALCREATARGVSFLAPRRLQDARKRGDHLFCIATEKESLVSPLLLLALGSPAWPRAQASDLGARLARSFGHTVFPFEAALVPFLMDASWPFTHLAGVSLPVRLQVGEHAFTRPLLFTHTGLSGPAALCASLYWHPGQPLVIDFLPGRRVHDEIEKAGKQQLGTLLRHLVPDRLARALLLLHPAGEALAHTRCAELARKRRDEIAALVHAFSATPRATAGMGQAEAARGGVDTATISPLTMESTLVPGLFMAGELLDITGELGGYNLHWAFASGHAAGRGMVAAHTKNTCAGQPPF